MRSDPATPSGGPTDEGLVTGGLVTAGDPVLDLPKAHLHLHFTGSMRLETLIELASSARTRLPSNFLDGDPLRVPADRRGWFRFQRAYDTARHLVTTEETMRRSFLRHVAATPQDYRARFGG